MTAILNEWTRMWPTVAAAPRNPARPRLAFREHEDRHEFFASLPGLRRDEVSVEVADGALVLRKVQPAADAEHSTETQEVKPRPFAVHEHFEHRIAIPKDADLTKITAHLEAGILTVTIPKKVAPAPVNVEVTSA